MKKEALRAAAAKLMKNCEEFLKDVPAKEKKTNPDVPHLIGFWAQEYERSFGRYPILGKDAAALKRALGTFPVSDIEQAMKGFLKSNDPFYIKNRNIAFFCTKIPEFNIKPKEHIKHCPFCLVAVPGDFMAHIAAHKQEVFKRGH